MVAEVRDHARCSGICALAMLEYIILDVDVCLQNLKNNQITNKTRTLLMLELRGC